MASSNSEIDKPQRVCPKRAEMLDVNMNIGMESINRESFKLDILSISFIDILCDMLGELRSKSLCLKIN